MSKSIIIKKNGGSEVLEIEEYYLDSQGPKKGEVRIKHTAIGVNYIDTYHRSGIYPVGLPSVLGLEAVGVVVAVGSGVEGLVVGDRVGYASGPVGAYCEERDYSSEKVIKIPDFISDIDAASVLLKGMTVEYLFQRTFKLEKGDMILFHAAAGGVGLLACQWARSIGVKMIGTVGTDEKASLAKKFGCSFVLNYKKQNIVEEVMKITENKGVRVVYDGVGKDTFDITLGCLSERGLFVSFGQSSGMIKNVGLHETFAPKNLYYTRPSLLIYNKTKNEIKKSAESLFKLIKEKKIKTSVFKTYKLDEVRNAHDDLQSRKTTGSLILVP